MNSKWDSPEMQHWSVSDDAQRTCVVLEVRPTEDVDPTITQTTVAQAVKELFDALQAWKMAKQGGIASILG